MDGTLNLPQITTPATGPDTGNARLYLGTDNRFYVQLPGGNALPIGNELTQDTATQTLNAAVASQALFGVKNFLQLCAKFVLGAGSGAYAVNITLPVTNVLPGATCLVNVELPGSANPTINFYDTTTSGTELQTVTNGTPAAAAYWFGIFKFGTDGHWQKLFSGWN